MTPIVHPLFGSEPINYSSVQVSDDPDSQVAATIDLMSQYAREDSHSDAIKKDASEAIGGDPFDPLTGVFEFVKSRMRFQNDEKTIEPIQSMIPNSSTAPVVEVLIRPVDLSRMTQSSLTPVGDCDDYSMYCASLLCALGIDCAFVTLAADSRDPSCYSHVYVVAYIGDRRLVMDCSHGECVGWESPNRFGKMREWPVNGSGAHPLIWGLLGAGVLWLIARLARYPNVS